MNANFYEMIFAFGGALAISAVVYMVLGGKKKKKMAYRYEKV
jgi:hypothetical protein